MSIGAPTVLSYGAGLDSFAMLLLAIERGEKPVVVFLDVGDRDRLDPGEWPGTYRHMREHAMPLCAREGIEFVWVTTADYPVRDARSLFAWLWARRQIPVSGPARVCTIVAKVERFERWLDDRFPDQDVDVSIGFEAGEETRAAKDPNAGTRRKPRSGAARRHNRFPLIEAQICRCRAEAMVRAAGYPVPRKSACVFCPYGNKADWQTFAREIPEEFARTVEMEARKPPTKNGFKLTIRAFDSRTKRGKLLPAYIEGEARLRREICKVCRAGFRASKAVGCGYLDEEARS